MGTLIETTGIQLVSTDLDDERQPRTMNPSACFNSPALGKVLGEVMVTADTGGTPQLLVSRSVAPDVHQYLDTVDFAKECFQAQNIPRANLTQGALMQATIIYTYLRSMNLPNGIAEAMFLRLLSSPGQ